MAQHAADLSFCHEFSAVRLLEKNDLNPRLTKVAKKQHMNYFALCGSFAPFQA